MKTAIQLARFSFLFISSFFSFMVNAQTIVTDGGELQDLVNEASPGDVFIVKDGVYTNFESTFTAMANVDNPITIKSESIGGVTLLGDSHFVLKKAAHIIIEGFVFDCESDNTLIKLEGSNNIRITRNVFELKTVEPIKWVFIGGIYNDYTFQHTSYHNRIDHNIFQNKTTPGHYITIDGTSNEDGSDSRQSQYDIIDHNYFRNNSPRAANEQESIRIGWSQMSMSSGYTTVEHNLFEDCDGDPEIVSVKSSDNIIRHNTFKRSYGTLSLRHGNRSRVEGNYFFGDGKENGTFGTSTIYTGGIRIYGTDHVIVNNYMEGLQGTIWDAPIALTQGDAIDGNSTNLTKHFRAERVIIAYNTLVDNVHGIEIGYDKPGSNPYNTKLKDITIANNLVTGTTNSMVEYINGNDQDGEVIWINNILYPMGNATIVAGGSAFSETEAVNVNPNLDFDGVVWKSTETSPLINSGVTTLGIDMDIEGQSRPENSNAGADHYSAESIRFAPLTPVDVGPNAYEDDNGSETLFISTVSEFSSESETQIVSITSNVDWTMTDNKDWIVVTPSSGSNNQNIEVTVLENTSLENRSGVITITGGSITRSISVTQKGANTTDGSTELIAISIDVSSEQAPNNTREKTLDKDLDTRWSAEGIGETITYDLGSLHEVSLIKIAMHKGSSRFTYFDIAVSTNEIDFKTVLTDQSNSKTTNELENYLFDASARYVRIVGKGNSDAGSDWNSITEVEIYGSNSLSIVKNESILGSKLLVYPVPVLNQLIIEDLGGDFAKVEIFSLKGKSLIQKQLDTSKSKHILNLQYLNKGIYLIQLYGEKKTIFKKIIVSQ